MFVGPLIPDRDAVIVEISNICIAAQKPKQLVNDRLDVQFLGGEQWKPRTGGTQIESRLRAEDRQGAGAGAVVAWLTVLEYELEQIMILSHAKNLSRRKVSPKQKLPDRPHVLFAILARKNLGQLKFRLRGSRPGLVYERI